MERQPERAPEKGSQPGTSKVVSLWLQRYASEFERGPGVDEKLNELTLNFMSLILNKAEQVADFKQTDNINSLHVNLAVDSIEQRRNRVEGTLVSIRQILPSFGNGELSKFKSWNG